MNGAQSTRKVNIKDLKPGMKVERLGPDLDFVYREVQAVYPNRPRGVLVSYSVHLAGFVPGVPEREQDSSVRPFVVRRSTSVDVLDEPETQPQAAQRELAEKFANRDMIREAAIDELVADEPEPEREPIEQFVDEISGEWTMAMDRFFTEVNVRASAKDMTGEQVRSALLMGYGSDILDEWDSWNEAGD